jgi:hypothetical protein
MIILVVNTWIDQVSERGEKIENLGFVLGRYNYRLNGSQGGALFIH